MGCYAQILTDTVSLREKKHKSSKYYVLIVLGHYIMKSTQQPCDTGKFIIVTTLQMKKIEACQVTQPRSRRAQV